jgi:CDP-diacylglycerol---serine O-phosphatidyltransferase
MITLGNLLCGCFSITSSSNGSYLMAIFWIALGLVFDFSDGLVARMLKVTSNLGKELDSLSDLLTFGLAPAMILYQYLKNVYDSETSILSLLPYLSFSIVIFSALRLGNFNLGKYQSKEGFIGLPTPANAILLSSFPLIQKHNPIIFENILHNPILLVGTMLFCSIILLLPIPFINLKFKNLVWRENRSRFMLLLVLLFGAIITYLLIGIAWIIPFTIFAYIFYSIILHSFKLTSTPPNLL